ncbi:MAG: NAD(P)H-dependent oxidoreductase [Nitrospinota bacterium]
MKKLLHIISSPRGEESRTLQVSEVFLEGFKDNHPDWIIEELDLTKEDLPPLTLKRVDGKYVLLGGKDLFGELKEAWQEIIAHINRFMSADAYLISTPMWNFSIPYQLKHYIDIIVQPKFLFRYIANDAEGLVKNKKMVVITSRGRDYSTEETRSADLQEPYLRLIFGFVGITDITFIIAQPMDMGTVLQERGLSTAKEKARAMAKDF